MTSADCTETHVVQVSFTGVFPPGRPFSSSWYVYHEFSFHCVLFVHSRHTPTQFQSFLCYLFGYLCYDVPLIYSFLVLPLCVAPHTHLKILIFIFASCPFVVSHVSAPYSIAGLTTVLQIFFCNFTGIFHCISSKDAFSEISVFMPPFSSTAD